MVEIYKNNSKVLQKSKLCIKMEKEQQLKCNMSVDNGFIGEHKKIARFRPYPPLDMAKIAQ
jgi:hypothetical protein